MYDARRYYCGCNVYQRATFNEESKESAPEMPQTKKGNEWYFGMKCHIKVDADSGYVHSLETTPANVYDITVAPKLLREDGSVMYGASGYIGIEKREEMQSSAYLSGKEY